MVCNVFRKNNECNRNICNRYCSYVFCVNRRKAFFSLKECEVGVPLHIVKEREVDNHKVVISRFNADYGENCRNSVACENTDDERNKFCHFFAVNRANHNSEKCYKRADKTDPAFSAHDVNRVCRIKFGKFKHIADCVARK